MDAGVLGVAVELHVDARGGELEFEIDERMAGSWGGEKGEGAFLDDELFARLVVPVDEGGEGGLSGVGLLGGEALVNLLAAFHVPAIVALAVEGDFAPADVDAPVVRERAARPFRDRRVPFGIKNV